LSDGTEGLIYSLTFRPVGANVAHPFDANTPFEWWRGT
jgi:hypothetical protein